MAGMTLPSLQTLTLARLAALLLALATALTTACSSPQETALPTTTGERLTVPIGRQNQVTLAPPKGWKQVEAQTWALPLGQDRILLLRANLGSEPEGGLDVYIDNQLKELGKLGQGGAERDERLVLDDLEARLLKVVDLRNKPPVALWMVAALAEDGLVTVSALGPLDDLRKHGEEIEKALRSLRIAAPVGVTREAPRPPALEDDLPEPGTERPTAEKPSAEKPGAEKPSAEKARPE